MRLNKYHIVPILLLAVIILSANPSIAKIYSYTDEDGVIHFVDSSDQIPGTPPKKPLRRIENKNLIQDLQQKFPPKNKIEAARNATVKIEAYGSFASGFFISSDRGTDPISLGDSSFDSSLFVR